ncbi:hypothetical protein BOTBODRAFT_188564 [Botryobasidium botryosum FD-172 SS1]|uniref:RNase III domain-containing protein n=1 Tax=Botryobasidium botryosum (strain FD-172 SS1) TaxID=930990 RepID=A0A067MEZ1_BOTB1|nr:hypothetical protein BOTBODRAFT_188564 [Botryobasidium botryosum FD-172 SS1]
MRAEALKKSSARATRIGQTGVHSLPIALSSPITFAVVAVDGEGACGFGWQVLQRRPMYLPRTMASREAQMDAKKAGERGIGAGKYIPIVVCSRVASFHVALDDPGQLFCFTVSSQPLPPTRLPPPPAMNSYKRSHLGSNESSQPGSKRRKLSQASQPAHPSTNANRGRNRGTGSRPRTQGKPAKRNAHSSHHASHNPPFINTTHSVVSTPNNAPFASYTGTPAANNNSRCAFPVPTNAASSGRTSHHGAQNPPIAQSANPATQGPAGAFPSSQPTSAGPSSTPSSAPPAPPQNIDAIGEKYAKRVPAYWRDAIRTRVAGVVHAHVITVAGGAPYLFMTHAPLADMSVLRQLPRPTTVVPLGVRHLEAKEVEWVHKCTQFMCQAGAGGRPNVPSHRAPYYLAPALKVFNVDEGREEWVMNSKALKEYSGPDPSAITLNANDRRDLAYAIGHINSLLLAKELNATLFSSGVDEALLLRALTSAKANPRWNLESLEFLGDAYLSFAWGITTFFARAPVQTEVALSNAELRRLAKAKKIPSYCSTDHNTYAASSLSAAYATQAGDGEVNQHMGPKEPADQSEAIIGAVLKSQGRSAAFRALKAFGIQLPSAINEWDDMLALIPGKVQEPEVSHGGRIEQCRKDVEILIGCPLARPLLFQEVLAKCALRSPGRGDFLALGAAIYAYHVSRYLCDRYEHLGPGVLTDLKHQIVATTTVSALTVHARLSKLIEEDPNLNKGSTTDKVRDFVRKASHARAVVDSSQYVESSQPEWYWGGLSAPGTLLCNPIHAVFAGFYLSRNVGAAFAFVDKVVDGFFQDFVAPGVLYSTLCTRLKGKRGDTFSLTVRRKEKTVEYRAVRNMEHLATGNGATVRAAARECCVAALEALMSERAADAERSIGL